MKLPRCPICDRSIVPEETKTMPFCSERCRNVDLNRWFGEKYGLLQVPEEEPDEPWNENESDSI